MSAPKLVLLILVLIAVVFATAVGLGVSRPSGDGDRDGWINSLEKFSTTLGPDDVEAPSDFLHENTFTLKPGTQGKAKIKRSSSMRSVVLELKEGLPVHVRFDPASKNEKGVEVVDASLTSQKKLKFPAGESGGTLTLTSGPGGTCKVRLGN